ncbi:unnamed protein product [Orchesella dallaii]|uniref:SET domain-containing protein n=1 Tax=Orchesella dallaii TaxID=48710 RepID=A0ABP1R1Y0_9HEXA
MFLGYDAPVLKNWTELANACAKNGTDWTDRLNKKSKYLEAHEELYLVKQLKDLHEGNAILRPIHASRFAYEVRKKTGRPIPTQHHRCRAATYDWYQGFKARHEKMLLPIKSLQNTLPHAAITEQMAPPDATHLDTVGADNLKATEPTSRTSSELYFNATTPNIITTTKFSKGEDVIEIGGVFLNNEGGECRFNQLKNHEKGKLLFQLGQNCNNCWIDANNNKFLSRYVTDSKNSNLQISVLPPTEPNTPHRFFYVASRDLEAGSILKYDYKTFSTSKFLNSTENF